MWHGQNDTLPVTHEDNKTGGPGRSAAWCTEKMRLKREVFVQNSLCKGYRWKVVQEGRIDSILFFFIKIQPQDSSVLKAVDEASIILASVGLQWLSLLQIQARCMCCCMTVMLCVSQICFFLHALDILNYKAGNTTCAFFPSWGDNYSGMLKYLHKTLLM